MGEILFKLGDRGNEIKDIHRKLASGNVDLGQDVQAFLCGPVSEHYNKDTARAIRAFQASQQLTPTGICDDATWHLLDREAGSVYAETLQFELDALRGERVPDGVRPADEDQVMRAAHEAKLAGLAFSGGGIRSATFNLGILQALAESRLLHAFDYLSSVSGGGYIAAHFTKWLHRLGGDIGAMEEQLAPGAHQKAEAKEIRFLRQYSNYLTPQTGFFSVDTWSVLATYIRNTALNMAILVAMLGAVLMLPHLLVRLHAYLDSSFPATYPLWCAIVAALAFACAVFFIALSISTIPDPARPGRIYGQTQSSVMIFIVAPLMLAGLAGSIALWHYRTHIGALWRQRALPPDAGAAVIPWLLLPGLGFFICWAAGWYTAQWYNRRLGNTGDAALDWRHVRNEGVGHLLCALVALGTGTLLLFKVLSDIGGWTGQAAARPPTDFIHVLVFGMPFMLSIFGISMILSVGLVGRMYKEKSREWWSRQGAWTSICTLAWLGLMAVSLYGPALVDYAGNHLDEWGTRLLAGGWVGATLAGVVLGRSSATDKRSPNRYLELLACVAPYVFAVGTLLLIAALVQMLAVPAQLQPHARAGDTPLSYLALSLHNTAQSRAPDLMWPLLILAASGVILSRRVDINKFSLYTMYRNRLVRAYLGASNEQRHAHPFSGFDENDDLNLNDMLKTAAGQLQRPYHIINTALNLVNGKELAWQTRKAAGFTFTPAFCGFEMPSMAAPGMLQLQQEAARGCFRGTAAYRRRHQIGGCESGIKLGMAMATSGAATSPNMGYHSSPPLAFLMTMFNVRLGRWFANPRKANWQTTSPKFGLRSLLSELFGYTDADADYIYLSDGGHFENLGIYELVRRRCRLIVAVDASADGVLDFEDLGNAIRKCGTDLHIEININVGKIDLLKGSDFSTSHCVTGTILYGKVDKGGPNGTLLYIKPSLIGKEFADVLNYRKTHRDFPHQTTADQWFDETQFESYRSLGYHIGTLALKDAAARAGAGAGGESHDIAGLCKELEKLWGPPPDTPLAGAVASVTSHDEGRRRRQERRQS
ncbi:peptidoglycan-binding protein [Janthinobacterium fluminis]|uniref:Patatin-like phospholipase family protein n=1 Tax=Janthinobacterium fluminis TaxID=2987524 RepID=A0ABT5K5V7_9BURK|nr:peptidoglycan-binding protein [Janthinobacterium fluminis]MDC8759778.1 patatin-like phospholipase family protein [Janthinobacterium fluminis]